MIATARPSWLTRPAVLRPVDSPKPWGWELWLTSTRPEGPALVEGASATLDALIAANPEALGAWSRSLFGDTMPIFAKFIHTSFPARVHLGFRRPVERGELLVWLEREQELLRLLFAAQRIADASAFGEYHARYSAWASTQSLAAWQSDDDEATASALAAFVDPNFDLRGWLRRVRTNRAAIVDTLNEIDLTREHGRLFLSGAGVIHAIFGLSHQTHPRDRARSALQALFGVLGERAARGASDAELARTIDDASLTLLRGTGGAPAKNEAWMPSTVDGAEVLVEPQQSSDTTYSLADFYTPLIWAGDRVRFRKGSSNGGLSREQLTDYLAEVDFEVSSIASIRREPIPVPTASRPGASLSRLVDEPTAWPFFTVYRLDLSGRFTAAPPPGVFQQLVVTEGRVALGDETGIVGELDPRTPGFIPATLLGRYTLTAHEPSTVLVFAVPGARGGAPRL